MLLKLAWRNLWRHSRRTVITVATIAFGLALTIFFVGMADGVYGKLVEMAVRLGTGHFTVEHTSYRDDPDIRHTITADDDFLASLRDTPEVTAVIPRITGNAMLSSSYNAVGAGFDAMLPSQMEETSVLANAIVEGRFLRDDDPIGILVGKELARKLQVGIDDKVVLTSQLPSRETTQELFRVRGIFETRSDTFDAFYCLLHLQRARRMFNFDADQATQIGVFVGDASVMDRVQPALREIIDARESVVLLPWSDVLTDLANFMAIDMASNTIIQVLLFLVVLVGVFNSVLMSVLERSYEFGVMLALGMRRWRLFVLIVLECGFVSLFGLLFGGSLGYALGARCVKSSPPVFLTVES